MNCGTAATENGMTKTYELGIVGLDTPLVIVTVGDNDRTESVEIPGMHLSEDCSEWLFNDVDEQDNTAAGGTGVGSTKPD